MNNKIEVTQEEITNLLIMILETADNSAFVDLDSKYTNVLDYQSLRHWEKEISEFSNKDCKISLPLSIIHTLEKENIPTGKFISFIKFILTLTVRFFSKVGDLKCINNLIFLACDNIDTWLLRNLDLRPIPFLNPSNKPECNKYINMNFLNYFKNKDTELTLVYKEIEELVDLILNAIIKIKLGEPLEELERDTIVNLLADHIRILMEKARYHKGSIGICSYCNSMYYYTHENKVSNQFLSMSSMNYTCSECFIELNKDTIKVKDMYIKTHNLATNKILLKYLIFSTEENQAGIKHTE